MSTTSVTGEANAASWENEQYSNAQPAVRRMRISVAGEQAVKNERETFLPHPCNDPTEQKTTEQTERYDSYITFAEYDNIPGNTLETLIGSMFRIKPTVEAPSLPNIIEDADGNGMSLQESIELTASECLQMRYFGLLAEYSDLAGRDPTEITEQQRRDEGLRATIKHYTREAIVNWSYAVINGVKQLNMVILREENVESFDPTQISKSGVTLCYTRSYLILGLEKLENGNYVYFQQRYIDSGKEGSTGEMTERFYPQANGAPLESIPFEMVFSTRRKVGDVPKQLGYLDPISAKAIHRYQASALLKEALRITAQPTSYSKGWSANSFKLYKEATGRDQINLGSNSHIPLFGEAEFGYADWNADSNALFKYREENKNEIVALGGVFDELGEMAETATAAAINSAEKKGVLATLAKNIEESYLRVLGWVAQFEGTDSNGVVIELSREFTAARITAADRAAILNEYREALISREEALQQLKRGGVLVGEIDQLLDAVENSPLI